MRECGGCRFCCWAWAVPEVTPELSHCKYECSAGCGIYSDRPEACKVFNCPYLDGASIHRPDTFQVALESLGGNIGNYIPAVPESVPLDEAIELLVRTRTILACYLDQSQDQSRWNLTVMPLDREADGSWHPADPSEWKSLCDKYSVISEHNGASSENETRNETEQQFR